MALVHNNVLFPVEATSSAASYAPSTHLPRGDKEGKDTFTVVVEDELVYHPYRIQSPSDTLGKFPVKVQASNNNVSSAASTRNGVNAAPPPTILSSATVVVASAAPPTVAPAQPAQPQHHPLQGNANLASRGVDGAAASSSRDVNPPPVASTSSGAPVVASASTIVASQSSSGLRTTAPVTEFDRPCTATTRQLANLYRHINKNVLRDRRRQAIKSANAQAEVAMQRKSSLHKQSSGAAAANGPLSEDPSLEAVESFGNVSPPYCDAMGHFAPVVGAEIASRYVVSDVLGRGTFGVVLRCFDTQRLEHVAVKVVRNHPNFTAQADLEVKVLLTICEWTRPHVLTRPAANGTSVAVSPAGGSAAVSSEFARLIQVASPHVVKLRKHMAWKGHAVLVFELLSQSVHDSLRAVEFVGLSIRSTVAIIRQIGAALALLSRAPHPVIHGDVKPENVLFVKNPSSGDAGATCHVKLIDFGSASFAAAPRQVRYVQSRYYRAPEVVLGYRYSCAIDSWSAACMLFEVYAGSPLFPAQDETDLLERVTDLLGPVDQRLISHSPKRTFFYVAVTPSNRSETDDQTQADLTGCAWALPRQLGAKITDNFYSKVSRPKHGATNEDGSKVPAPAAVCVPHTAVRDDVLRACTSPLQSPERRARILARLNMVKQRNVDRSHAAFVHRQQQAIKQHQLLALQHAHVQEPQHLKAAHVTDVTSAGIGSRQQSVSSASSIEQKFVSQSSLGSTTSPTNATAAAQNMASLLAAAAVAPAFVPTLEREEHVHLLVEALERMLQVDPNIRPPPSQWLQLPLFQHFAQ